MWSLNRGCLITLLQLKEPKKLKNLKGKSSVWYRKYLYELIERGYVTAEGKRDGKRWYLIYSLTKKGIEFLNEHDEDDINEMIKLTDHHKLALLNFFVTRQGVDSKYIKNCTLTKYGHKYYKLWMKYTGK